MMATARCGSCIGPEAGLGVVYGRIGDGEVEARCAIANTNAKVCGIVLERMFAMSQLILKDDIDV